MAKRKTAKKKEEVNIMGKKYKVDLEVSNTLKQIAEALHSHEVALLTWLHKEYSGKKLIKEELEAFRSSLREYCMQIPEAENILKRMKELDAQVEKDIKDKENNNKSQNKDKESQGVEE